MINFFKRKPKSELEVVGKTDRVLVFEGTTTWHVRRKIRKDNHLVIVNRFIQDPVLNYGWADDCFTFISEVRDGDILRVIWL